MCEWEYTHASGANGICSATCFGLNLWSVRGASKPMGASWGRPDSGCNGDIMRRDRKMHTKDLRGPSSVHGMLRMLCPESVTSSLFLSLFPSLSLSSSSSETPFLAFANTCDGYTRPFLGRDGHSSTKGSAQHNGTHRGSGLESVGLFVCWFAAVVGGWPSEWSLADHFESSTTHRLIQ